VRRVPLLVILLACACTHTFHPEREDWLELRSEHFVVRTDLDREAAAQTLIDLEQVRATFVRFIASAAPQPSGQMQVIQFADSDELAEFVGRGVGGVATTDVFGRPLTVMGIWRSSRPLPILQHELAHLVSASVLPRQPMWFAEGLACYFETVRKDPRTETMIVGEPLPERVTYLDVRFPNSFGWMVRDEPLGITYGFETAAWLLVHYFEDARPQQFDAFMDALAQGKKPRAAYESAFPGLTEEKLSGELRDYFKAGRLGTLSVPAPDWSGKIAVRKLAPAEIRALRSEIFLLPRIEHAVRREVANALSLDPGEPEAIAVRGKLDGANPQEQIALARKATKLHPDDVRAWLVFLDALPKKPHPERHEAVQAALRAAPAEPGALIAAAWDAIDSSQPAEAAKWATTALRTAPWSIEALEALASATAADGRCGEAADVMERAVNMLSSHKVFAKRRQRLREQRARFASGGEECRGAVRPAVASDADRG
jgi:hypothetical protein